MTEGRGETPDAGREGTESPTAKREPENPATGESLMEEVCERENLEDGVASSPLQQREPRRRWQDHRRDPGLPA